MIEDREICRIFGVTSSLKSRVPDGLHCRIIQVTTKLVSPSNEENGQKGKKLKRQRGAWFGLGSNLEDKLGIDVRFCGGDVEILRLDKAKKEFVDNL